MRILFAVLHTGKKKIESCVELDDGKKVKVDFVWSDKSDSFIPPRYWAESILREADFQFRRCRTPTTLSDYERIGLKGRR